MIDEKRLIQILEDNGETAKCSGLYLSLEMRKKLFCLKRMMKKHRLLREDSKSDYLAKWLLENFSLLEENILSDSVLIARAKKMSKGKRYPRFFEIFCLCLDENARITKDEMKNIFTFINDNEKNVNLSDGINMLPLFRTAIYDKILVLFEKAFLQTEKSENMLDTVENLFFSLDELSVLTNGDALKNNPVELMLAKDPENIYPNLCEQTKNNYRHNLIRLSSNRKVSQLALCKSIVEKCQNGKEPRERHIGFYLCDKAEKGMTYLVLLGFLTLLFTQLLCLVSPLMILTVFSVYNCTKLVLEKFFVRFFVKPFHIPRVELSDIPDKEGVMVVITTLLSGESQDEKVFENLEKMYYSNGEKNVYFGVLCDLPDSDTLENERDKGIIENANKKICTLRKKYGGSFYFFVRQREYSQSERKYIAPERKRGAVDALVKLLCSKSNEFSYGSILPDEEVCKNIRYVFTLDSDTNLAFDCLKTMVGIMLCPVNKPISDVKNAKVVKGYGILQPSMSTTLDGAMKSFFTKIMCGHGGIDVYSSGGSDKNMPLFGTSIFCGKGMFDKNAFYDTLCGKNEFEKGKILSHDAPEGARLRCAYVADVTLTDSFPREQLSYYKRQHRWIRGDIQNIPFLMPTVKNAYGQKVKNKIGVFARFFLFENVMAALFPIFTLACVIVSVLCGGSLSKLIVTVSFSAYILPFVYSFFSIAKRAIFHNIKRLFFSHGIYTGIWTSFMQTVFRICAIPKSAAVYLDAVSRAAYRRVISGKNTLEWMTAAQSDSERSDGLLGYVKKNLICAVAGCLVFVITDGGFLKFVSLLWLFTPVFAYHSAKPHKKSKLLSKEQKKTLTDYAKDMWKFFDENVNQRTNHLPPDNISFYPERKISEMTSPTNIGLYLLSVSAARKFGFIDSVEMECRIDNCTKTLRELATCRGLLYNWYNIYTKKPMKPDYVSSVDLGNYVACLECTRAALSEFKDEMKNAPEIIKRVEELIEQTDLSLLFDNNKKLFYIGFTKTENGIVYDKNRYDMQMSEARILSFCAVAKKSVPCEHLRHLSRRFVEGGGYFGLASWSGTAFEYFMPELFIKSKEGSLIYEALGFCFMNQIKSGVLTDNGRIFGISESCYNELDAYSNYKYHAFGVQKNALRFFDQESVFSPYSCFLLLPMSVKECLLSLKNMQNMGMYREYGFCESVDFERHQKDESYAVVRCFMSHHLGMSICAAANSVLDGQICNWFSQNPYFNSALELADEKIPYDAYVKKTARKKYPYLYTKYNAEKKTPLNDCISARLVNDNLSLYAKKDRLYIDYSNLMLTNRKACDKSLRGFGVYVSIGGERYAVGQLCSLLTDGAKVVYSRCIKTFGAEVFEVSFGVTLGRGASDYVMFRWRLRRLSGEQKNNIRVEIAFVPVCDTQKNADRCSFFENEALFFSIADDGKAVFENKRSNIRMVSDFVCGKNQHCRVENGAVISECCPEKKDGIYECVYAMSLSYNKNSAEDGLQECKALGFDAAAQRLMQKAQQNNREDKKATVRRDISGAQGENCQYAEAFPVKSREDAYFVMSGKAFSTLLRQNGLGFSFCNDVNQGRITAFDNLGKESGERLIFCQSGFDIIKNSTGTSFGEGIYVYEGNCGTFRYTAYVFIPENEPFKIIHLVTNCRESVEFTVNPCKELCRNMRVAGGMGMFSSDITKSGVGFVYGCDIGEKVCSDYSVENGVRARLESGSGDYVFAVGYAESVSKAQEYRQLVTEKLCEIKKSAKELCKKLKCETELMDKAVKSVLENYFVFPENPINYRSLIHTSKAIKGFDCLLLAYGDGNLFKEVFLSYIRTFGVKDCLEMLMVCLCLCEYIRVQDDLSVLDENVSGEDLYRFCLSCLYKADEQCQKELDGLKKITQKHFSKLCYRLGDVRTAIELEDIAKKCGESGGCFV